MGNFIAYELLPIILNRNLTASTVRLFVLMARLILQKAPGGTLLRTVTGSAVPAAVPAISDLSLIHI